MDVPSRWSRRFGGLDAADDLVAVVAFGAGEVVWGLEVEPELRVVAEIAAEAERGVGGDRTPAVEDVRDAARGHAEVEGQPIGAEILRIQLATKKAAGMDEGRHGISR